MLFCRGDLKYPGQSLKRVRATVASRNNDRRFATFSGVCFLPEKGFADDGPNQAQRSAQALYRRRT